MSRGIFFACLVTSCCLAAVVIDAQTVPIVADSATPADSPSPPKATAEDELALQIVILKSQLSQALASAAKCEAEGPQSAKVAQDAQAAGQALVKALDARGLTVNEKNQIVEKSKPDDVKPADVKPAEPKSAVKKPTVKQP
jgi:hypothetical protein